MTTKPAFTVGYWSIKGLAAPLSMMMMFRQMPHQFIGYDCKETETKDGFDRSAWYDAKELLKVEHPLLNLPYVRDEESGRIVTQSNACVLFLGRKLKLLGCNDDELSECEQLLFEATDVRNEMTPYCYGRVVAEQDTQQWLDNMFSSGKALHKLNLWLERKYPDTEDGVSLFFVGNSATAPDFCIWDICNQLKQLAAYFKCPDPFVAYAPKLHAFRTSFKALPENQNYLKSKLYALPCNNLSARRYGATPSGDAWVFGGDHYWAGTASGVY